MARHYNENRVPVLGFTLVLLKIMKSVVDVHFTGWYPLNWRYLSELFRTGLIFMSMQRKVSLMMVFRYIPKMYYNSIKGDL